MPSKPVQISVDQKLLRRIDRDPETKRHGRSAFIRNAVEVYLRAKQRRDADQSIRRAYAGRADDLVEDVEDLMDTQAWPDE